MCQALNLNDLIKSLGQANIMTLILKMKKQRLRKVKVTKQVVQPGTQPTCSTTLQAQQEMGAEGRAENPEPMKEPVWKHVTVGEV